jgi:hypothetical protein
MSHSHGQVRFDADGLVMHYEYNGTADVVISHLHDSADGVERYWRKAVDWLRCDCGRDEPVRIATSYGGGFHWPGRACRHCKAVTDGLDPLQQGGAFYVDGLPEWWHDR